MSVCVLTASQVLHASQCLHHVSTIVPQSLHSDANCPATSTPTPAQTGKGRAAWADLLVAVESSLGLIDQQSEAILRHASHLHTATGGVIGDLTGMLQMLAIDAIDSGTERLDLDSVFGTVAPLTQAPTSVTT